jgi:hypothetical protein
MADKFQFALLFESLENLGNLDWVHSDVHDDPFSMLQFRHIVWVFERLSPPPFAFATIWSWVKRTSPSSTVPQRFKWNGELFIPGRGLRSIAKWVALIPQQWHLMPVLKKVNSRSDATLTGTPLTSTRFLFLAVVPP